jgi:hypothetical protein
MEKEDGMVHMQHSLATARIPEDVAKGVFANEIILLRGDDEVAIDFIQSIASPRQLVSRVIMTAESAKKMIKALEEKITNCTVVVNGCSFTLSGEGSVRLEDGMQQTETSVSEIYETTKVQDEILMGKYANIVSVTQNNGDFCIDFMVALFPRSVVSARIFLSMHHAYELLVALRK